MLVPKCFMVFTTSASNKSGNKSPLTETMRSATHRGGGRRGGAGWADRAGRGGTGITDGAYTAVLHGWLGGRSCRL